MDGQGRSKITNMKTKTKSSHTLELCSLESPLHRLLV